MEHNLSLKEVRQKEMFDLGEAFTQENRFGQKIGFNNYYMKENEKPFFGISGEFHFSRCDASRWEDELIKMKMGGINVVSTYMFWIHHEEEEGVFDFRGSKDIRRFLEICREQKLYVILRVGPFDHGEVRNGGIPDWMYGKPFDVRQLNEGFLYYTKRLYTRIGKEVKGMFFEDGGPVIGVQIDNEYMHSSAPWELTTGISDEWIVSGNEGNAYMLALRDLAKECGLIPAFYTCTGWGGAATPEDMVPLWGGYAFRPWLFYSHQGEHPSTEEYVYQDFHNNDIPCTNDFQPAYKPEDRPYACCEMGGGMFSSYNYRFILPFKSVDAMANIKMASGCNFLGYYMYQGGTNPVGKSGIFMNESQVPKLSYDFQAPLGEFGQIRESYRRLKTLHCFAQTYQEELCGLGTVLPDGASQIAPKDLETLRYAVRTDGKRGFVFINNYQDHEITPDKKDETIILTLKDEIISFSDISIAGDENCIFPFHMDLCGMDLVSATAQPVTYVENEGERTYVFMRPQGTKAKFLFGKSVRVNETDANSFVMSMDEEAELFTISEGEKKCRILVVSRKLSDNMYKLDEHALLFTGAAVLKKKEGIWLETREADNKVQTYPAGLLDQSKYVTCSSKSQDAVLGEYVVERDEKKVDIEVKPVGEHRYTISLPEDCTDGVQDLILRLDYSGDIGHAFFDGKMINDNFCNGDIWEIGLRTFKEELTKNPLTIYITPLREGANVNVESTMAGRREEVSNTRGVLHGVEAVPVYQIQIV